MRFNDSDYFWINDMDHVMLMHPIKPALEGKSLVDFKDKKGKTIFQEFVKICQSKGEGFVDYFWPKPGNDAPVAKLSYVKEFKPWGWIIGTGVYMESVEQNFKARALDQIGSMRYGPELKDYFWINDMVSTMLKQPVFPSLEGKDLSQLEDKNGKKIFQEFVKVCRESGSGFVEYVWPKPGADKSVALPKLSYVQRFEGWDWVVGTGVYVDDIDNIMAEKQKQTNAAIAGQIFRMIVVIVLLCGGIIGVTIFIVTRSITRPLASVGAILKDIASGEGDLTRRIEVASEDEIGEMAKWFNLFIEKLQGIIREIAANADTLATSSEGLLEFSTVISSESESMSTTANVAADSAEQMSGSLDTVAGSTSEASGNIEVVAAASQEMTSTISEIAQNMENARTRSDQAVQQAAGASDKITELGNAAKDIGRFTETITEISEQTNLLALNATIEAARAGDAGKGFAVVANEIKELARQTADATSEIKTQIDGIQASASGSTTEIKQITKVISDINEMVSSVSAAVEEQSVTTSEIANNVSQAANMIGDINDNVSQASSAGSSIAGDIAGVSTSATEMATSASQLKTSAEDLNNLADAIEGLVGKFKV